MRSAYVFQKEIALKSKKYESVCDSVLFPRASQERDNKVIKHSTGV